MAVAVVDSVPQTAALGGDQLPASLSDLARLRHEWYDCLILRSDALFELTNAVLCADGPVTSMVGLSLTAEHRRGHGALYDTHPRSEPSVIAVWGRFCRISGKIVPNRRSWKGAGGRHRNPGVPDGNPTRFSQEPSLWRWRDRCSAGWATASLARSS
jgi:hypothetical protein